MLLLSARPKKTKERVADLIQREKTNGILPEEESELNHCLQLEHLMRLAKARVNISPVAGRISPESASLK